MKPLAVSFAAISIFFDLSTVCSSQELMARDIVNSLRPKSLTRSIGGDGSALSEVQRSRIESLTRSIAVVPKDEREEALAEVAAIVERSKLPKLDFPIYFEFNSAEISTQSLPVLDQLGTALASPELRGMSYLVNGHTDAKGSEEYNQLLSERRAMAVTTYLSRFHGIDRTKLKPLGYGETALKDDTAPDSAINRRVEIVNLTY